MERWRQEAITGDLTEVPGIGPKAAETLANGEGDDKITNTYQLFGKFLMLKGPDEEGRKVESFEHTEKFWYFLKSRGIASHRSAIVKAIAGKARVLLLLHAFIWFSSSTTFIDPTKPNICLSWCSVHTEN